MSMFLSLIILSFIWLVGFVMHYWWVILVAVIIEHFATKEDSPKQKRQKVRKRLRRY